MRPARSRKFDPIRPMPESASLPEKIAAKANTEDWSFRRPILNNLPNRLSTPVAKRYVEIHQTKSRFDANIYMLDVNDRLNNCALALSASDDELVSIAKKNAHECFYLRMGYKDDAKAYDYLINYVSVRYKINPPLANRETFTPISDTDTDIVTDCNGYRNVTYTPTITAKLPIRNVTLSIKGVLNRLCDELWWRRTLRNVTARNVEQYSIDLGLVHQHAGIYISEESMQRNRQQKRRVRRAMEKITLTNELGEEFNLQELIDKSQANPANRRAELMVRIRGTEDISIHLGHQAVFYTITCPSRMHARSSKTGKANPKYDGTTPRQAQKYLTDIWARVRAQLARDEVTYYGFRVVEPHQDGTPHWHLLLFMEKDNISKVTQVLRDHAMREDGDEKGAKEHRFVEEIIDPKKGSATGYIAKYISKSIDGYGVDDDLYGHDAKDSAQRIRAWASLWGIRQFQQLGGPPVTLWRELRRVQGDALTGLLMEAWEAADSGNWKQFIQLMGGPTTSRKDCPLKIARLWSDEPNKYQESKGYQIIGVEYGSVLIPSRIHQWTIKYEAEKISRVFNADGQLVDFNGPPLERLRVIEKSFEKISQPTPLDPLEFCQ